VVGLSVDRSDIRAVEYLILIESHIMKFQNSKMLSGLFIASLVTCGALLGDHHEKHAANATGVWKWTSEGRNNQTRESTLTLIQDGSKLTGTVSGRQSDTKISGGKVDGNKISFGTSRESERGKFEAKYTGTVDGDQLNGEMKMTFGDRKFEREFEAKRQPAKPSGEWDWVLTRDDGEDMTATLVLKEADGKVTGSISSDNFELDLAKVTLNGAVLKFETTFEGGNGSMKISHEAAILGDKIMGRASGERDGEEFTREWEATRS
jgi:hypothetical protein